MRDWLKYLAVGNLTALPPPWSEPGLSLHGALAIARALTRQPTFSYNRPGIFTYVFKKGRAAVFAGCGTSNAVCPGCCMIFGELEKLCEFARVAEGTAFFVLMGDARVPIEERLWPRALPVITKARWIGGPGVLLPLQFELHWAQSWLPLQSQRVPWERKRGEVLFWRGGTGGISSGSRQRAEFVHALRVLGHDVLFDDFSIDGNNIDDLVRNGGEAPGGLAFVRGEDGRVQSVRDGNNNSVLTRADVATPGLGLPGRQLARQFRYLLVLEGNDFASGLKWALASDSVVVMPPPTTESWLGEGLLRPYEHYVPLESPADASQTMNWLHSHADRVQAIIENANAFMRRAASRRGVTGQLAEGRATKCSPGGFTTLRCMMSSRMARSLIDHAARAWRQANEAIKTGGDGDDDGAPVRWAHWAEGGGQSGCVDVVGGVDGGRRGAAPRNVEINVPVPVPVGATETNAGDELLAGWRRWRQRRRPWQPRSSPPTVVPSQPTNDPQPSHDGSASALIAPIQIGHLVNGSIPAPEGTAYVHMEIGCSDMFTADEEVLPKEPRAFLIAFEPLLDKYAVLLARGTARYHGSDARDRSVPLAHHHKRGVVLPLAVSPSGGMLPFYVSDVAGCSSMLPRNSSADSWAPHCAPQLEMRLVPSISLSAALRLTGQLSVHHLKIDAQGVDFAIIRRTDPRLLRAKVGFIAMEVIASDCPPLYVGQERCDEVVSYLRSIGYDYNPSGWGVHHTRCFNWTEEHPPSDLGPGPNDSSHSSLPLPPPGPARKVCEADVGFQRVSSWQPSTASRARGPARDAYAHVSPSE